MVILTGDGGVKMGNTVDAMLRVETFFSPVADAATCAMLSEAKARALLGPQVSPEAS